LSEVSSMLEKDIRDKKRTGSGIHHCKGKRGYVGKMLFPSDLMSRKEKYNHRKGGKVEVTNMYDTIIPYFDFKELPEDQKKNHLTAYRNKFTNKEITDAWGISLNTFYKVVKGLDLPKATYSKTTRKGKKAPKQVEKVNTPAVPVEAYLIEQKLPEMVQNQIDTKLNTIEEEDGFSFKVKGTYDTNKLIKRLEKLALILDDEESEFEVNISIKEK
jgi:hypothetical protein